MLVNDFIHNIAGYINAHGGTRVLVNDFTPMNWYIHGGEEIE